MKRDLYIHDKRPIKINPHGKIGQGAYLHEKRPIHDQASANDTYKFDLQKRYFVQEDLLSHEYSPPRPSGA